MTPSDVSYVRRMIAAGLVRSPCLELGVAYQTPGEGIIEDANFAANLKSVLTEAGIAYAGSDMVPGPFVDHLVNFEDEPAQVHEAIGAAGEFGTVLVLNVLEHTFEPIRVLDNILSIIRPGGTCVAVTPTLWPIHGYPSDHYRILPDFYEEYCRRRGLDLIADTFEFLGYGKVHASGRPGVDHRYAFPEPGTQAQRTLSRIVHKLFGTTGRGMFFPSHVSIGAVIRKPAPA